MPLGVAGIVSSSCTENTRTCFSPGLSDITGQLNMRDDELKLPPPASISLLYSSVSPIVSSKVKSLAVPPLFWAVNVKVMRSLALAVTVVAFTLPWDTFVAVFESSIFAGGVTQPTGTVTVLSVKLFVIEQSVVLEINVLFICTV